MSVRETANEAAKWWPLLLGGVLFAAGTVSGAGVELVALLALIALQALWIGAWYGVPWLARKAGSAVA